MVMQCCLLTGKHTEEETEIDMFTSLNQCFNCEKISNKAV